MKSKTSITPETKLPLKLTAAQRKLLLSLPCLEANHAKTKTKERELDAVFEKVEALQEQYTEEESPQ